MSVEVFSDHRRARASGRQLGRWAVPRSSARARTVRTAVYLLVVLTAGVYLPSPLYPAYQHTFGFSDLTMTLIYAMFALVSAPALLVFGSASDAVGPRTVLRLSVLMAALASVFFALADGPGWLLAGRAAQGLALGAATGAATVLITQHAPTGRRARGPLLASMAFVAGTAAGPITAGAVAQYAPAPQTLPYLLHLVLLAGGVWRLRTLPAPAAVSSGAASPLARWQLTRPRIPAGMRLLFAAAAATGFVAWTVAGLFLAVVPAVLDRSAQISNLAIIGGVVSAVLVCSVLSQPLVARCGVRIAQLVGLGALLASLVILALTGGGSVTATMIAAVAAGIGHGLANGGATAAIDPVTPDGERAAIYSALYLTFYLGSAGPAIAVGLLTLTQPLPAAISVLSAAAVALVPVAGVAVMRTHRTSRPARFRTRRTIERTRVRTTPRSLRRHRLSPGATRSRRARAY